MKYGSVSVDVGDVAVASNRRPEGLKQRLSVLSIISLGLAVMCLSVWGAEPWGKGEQGLLLQRGLIPRASKNAGIEQQLWFGPGITDQLNRYVRIGTENVSNLHSLLPACNSSASLHYDISKDHSEGLLLHGVSCLLAACPATLLFFHMHFRPSLSFDLLNGTTPLACVYLPRNIDIRKMSVLMFGSFNASTRFAWILVCCCTCRAHCAGHTTNCFMGSTLSRTNL